MAGYLGAIPVPQATQHRESFTATSGQTTFNTAGYTVGFLDVYLNGSHLSPADFTATNGSDVVLASGASADDVCDIISYTAFEVNSQTFTGTTTLTGDLLLGDNDKAIFGAGSDLQIYHSGTHSFIDDAGQGNLYVRGNSIQVGKYTGEIGLKVQADDAVTLYYDNASKLATTSTGIDVTGTVTADGLTVDGDVHIDDAVPILRLDSPSATWSGGEDLGGIDWYTKDTSGSGPAVMARIYSESSGSNSLPIPNMIFQTSVADVSLKDRMLISGNGDISFYEDTGSTAKFFWDASAESLGIGTTSPAELLTVYHATNSKLLISTGANGASQLYFGDNGSNLAGRIYYDHSANSMRFHVNADERFRIDSSGNLLVGTTDNNVADNSGTSNSGFNVRSSGRVLIAEPENAGLWVNRLGNDGDIAVFRKDGTTVGSIGANGGQLYVGSGDVGVRFRYGSSDAIEPFNPSTGALRNDAIDLGHSSNKFDDIFATNGTIQTSDANEKQDIAALTSAEMLVAKRISALFKTFRWKDKVAEKGDNARTHTGIIAQDVQAAFTAESLDAGEYALFISSTWWEHDVDVPAVEAADAVDAVYREVTDSDGMVTNELVTPAKEAVEAVDAYTRTDTYDTQSEAPEGATSKTRMGIRYPELLSFVAAYNEQRFASIETRLTALEG